MEPYLPLLDNISQTFILVVGAAAIWLVGRREAWKRWGYIFGMITQPFWFYTTIRAEQWGLFALSLWYTYSWGQGIYNYWFKAQPED
ncbi:MAG: hypothetical protein RRB13_11030 [bacterium]|nr:hypothetical protein [bacterium]